MKWFKQDKLSKKIFAVREGTFKGYFLVYVSTIGDDLNFLVLPENETLTITKAQWKEGIDNKIVDYIRKIPNNVYEICCAQYNESKARSDINRLKQSAASSGMDSGECKNER